METSQSLKFFFFLPIYILSCINGQKKPNLTWTIFSSHTEMQIHFIESIHRQMTYLTESTQQSHLPSFSFHRLRCAHDVSVVRK